MTRLGDLMRRMPELAALESRLADPDWHPTNQETAQAWSIVRAPRRDRQESLALNDKQEAA